MFHGILWLCEPKGHACHFPVFEGFLHDCSKKKKMCISSVWRQCNLQYWLFMVQHALNVKLFCIWSNMFCFCSWWILTVKQVRAPSFTHSGTKLPMKWSPSCWGSDLFITPRGHSTFLCWAPWLQSWTVDFSCFHWRAFPEKDGGATKGTGGNIL